MNIDPMVWRLSEAHPRLRPQWLRDRMVPMLHPRKHVPSGNPLAFKYMRHRRKPEPKIEITPPAPEPEKKPPSIAKIVSTVATITGVSELDMKSERRTTNIVRPRQIAMYLAKNLTLSSLPKIGRYFGDRDHTTVIAAVRRIEKTMTFDPVVADVVKKAWAQVAAE